MTVAHQPVVRRELDACSRPSYRRLLLCAALAILFVTVASGAAPDPPDDINRLAALARLYGVVRWFHPADAAQEIDWNRFAVHAVRRVRRARGVGEFGRVLRELFAPLTVRAEIGTTVHETTRAPQPEEPLVAWRHLGLGGGTSDRPPSIEIGKRVGPYISARTNRSGEIAAVLERMPPDLPLRADAHVNVDLGAGLRANVPLALLDSEARVSAERRLQLDALEADLARLSTAENDDGDLYAADVIVAWSVFRHFYPYWAEVGVDWDQMLPQFLEEGSIAGSREDHRNVLRRLVAETGDGHGLVRDPLEQSPMAWLPIAVRWLNGRLVVTASAVPEKVLPGDTIVEIDGRSADSWFHEWESLAAGSPQRRAFAVVAGLTRGILGRPTVLTVTRPSATLEVGLRYLLHAPVQDPRPDPITQLGAGAWYIDLGRIRWSGLERRLSELAHARAVVFDMRGYPTDAGGGILPHLMTTAEEDRWMHVPCIIQPFGRIAGWRHQGWNLTPIPPLLGGRIAFLTDARALSQAESILGYVKGLRLGVVVGTATAGVNGNVNRFELPSGITISFTGMRITGHDGSPFHLIGVQPDVRVEPTADGIRAGRDEVLERALEAVGVRSLFTGPPTEGDRRVGELLSASPHPIHLSDRPDEQPHWRELAQ